MAFSVSVPLNDNVAEAKITAAFKNDPGASPHGEYINSSTAIAMSEKYSNLVQHRVFFLE
jgi:hypothetical protein